MYVSDFLELVCHAITTMGRGELTKHPEPGELTKHPEPGELTKHTEPVSTVKIAHVLTFPCPTQYIYNNSNATRVIKSM